MKLSTSIRLILFYFILLPIHLYADTLVQIEENTPSLKSFTLEYGEEVTSFSEIDKDTVWKPTENKVHFVPKKEYWYKISLHNATSSIQTRILFFTETNIEYINFYHNKEGVFVKERAGASIRPNQRSVDSHLTAFKMTLQPYETATFYVHIHSLLPSFEEIWILTERDFTNYEKKSLLTYVAYFGILLTTLIYSLIVTITTKEKILAVNTLYLFFSLLWILLNSGIYLYFFPTYIAWRLSCSAAISYVLLIEFAKFFIKIKEISIHLHRFVIALQVVLTLTAILSFWDMTLGISALVYVGFVVLSFLIITILIFLFAPIKNIIKIYLIILLPLLSSLLVYLLASAKLIDPSFRYQYFYLIGSFVELNGFAMLSLFYILKMKQEKEKEKRELATLRENYTVHLEKEIMEKTETLYITNQELEKNLNYQAALMQEIHHRVKNNLQMIISIISLEMLKSKSEDVNSILKNTVIRIQSISSIHEMLYRSSDISSISLSDYTRNLMQSVRSLLNHHNVTIFISCNDYKIGMRDAINLGLIIVELVSNSIKHNQNATHLKINVRISHSHSKLSLIIKDNGSGFDIHKTDLSKSIGINLIGSIAGSFDDAHYDFYQRKGMLFAFSCNFANHSH